MFTKSLKKFMTRTVTSLVFVASLAAGSSANATILLGNENVWDRVYWNRIPLNEDGVMSTLNAFCVEHWRLPVAFASAPQEYTLDKDGMTYFGATLYESLGELLTAFDIYNGTTETTLEELGSIQVAIWALQGTDMTGVVEPLADQLIAAMDPANNWYQEIGVYKNDIYQDYLWFRRTGDENNVPEPSSLALALLALGGMAKLARNRKLAGGAPSLAAA